MLAPIIGAEVTHPRQGRPRCVVRQRHHGLRSYTNAETTKAAHTTIAVLHATAPAAIRMSRP